MTSESSALAAVIARLEKFERQNRRLKVTGVLILVLAGTGLLMAQAGPGKVPSVIEAEKFVLKDTGGKILGELTTVADRKAVVLDLYGPDGTVLTRLGTGGLWLLDKDAKSRVVLNTSTPGTPSLFISDSNGKGGISLLTFPHGPGLTFHDKDGTALVTLNITSRFGSVLTFSDKREKPRIEIQVQPDGTSAITFSDKQGKERVGLHVSPEGLPSVQVLNKDSKVIWHEP